MAGGSGSGSGGTIIRIALQFLKKIRKRAGQSRGSAPRTAPRTTPPAPAGSYTTRPVYRDRHGFLTDGTYRASGQANLRHTYGHAPEGRSYFREGTDVDRLSLDAAQYADHNSLWRDNKAKVPFNIDVGWHQSGNAWTNVVNVYRRLNGTIHISPGSRLD
jgi:hypothetical protein